MRYEDNDCGKGSGALLLSFLIGGIVGAAAALVFAPKSGRQTREQIKGVAEDAKERAEDYYDQARTKISSAMQKGAEAFQHKKSESQSAGQEEKE